MSVPNPPGPPDPSLPPVPKYGEYAPPGYVPPRIAPGYEHLVPGYGAAQGRSRKTWDLVLTIILLVTGFFGMLIGFFYAALFTSAEFMDQVAQGAGLPGFSGEVGAAPAVIFVSHLLLYLAALGVSIPLLIAKRIAFWVPLTAGVIAAIVFWASFVAVIMSDPALMSVR